ncbi:MAG: phosphatase PAP2 family protein [Nanoarchaeota archaeon]|nr:phosphatase PAP2 family protein [Nanoarchaeota archaeon]MBU4116950.1 phosphatase PAP2 family protein [Nanoarchaeota archaeon]
MNKKSLIIILIILLGIVSLYFDSEISKGISLIRNNFLNEVFLGITFISSELIIFFFLTSLFLIKDHKRKYLLPLWVSLGLSVIISFILKISIQRLRPFQQEMVSILPILEKASHLIWNFSFPSFQAMLVFCAIPVISKEFPKFKYIWIIFAGLVALSRVYFGLHFLSDVIAGSLIGYLIGAFVINRKALQEFSFKKK